MRLHNFFIEQNIGEAKMLTITQPGLLHQWLRVLKFKKSHRVVLLDNTGWQYVSEITSLSGEAAELNILSRAQNKNIPAKEIWLFQAVTKWNTFDLAVEKVVELGVSHIIPVVSDRSEKKFVNEVRLEKIIREASEQSGRGILPELHDKTTLESAVAEVALPAVAFHPEGPRFKPAEFTQHQKISIFIGPEGGWNDLELELFRQKKINIFSFGPQILRAETAAMAASALLLLC